MCTCEENDEAGSVAAELLELVAALDDEINCGKTFYFQIPYGITQHKRCTRTVMYGTVCASCLEWGSCEGTGHDVQGCQTGPGDHGEVPMTDRLDKRVYRDKLAYGVCAQDWGGRTSGPGRL